MMLVNLWDKVKKCRWAFVSVYGPTHEELKDGFLAELASLCYGIDIPYIVGGDFNILRHVLEKNKPTVLPHSSEVLNTVIHSLSLREIHMKGGMYTWSNKQRNPNMEKLDRILMDGGWEQLFPLASIKKVVKDQSDHNLLILDSGEIPIPKHNRDFKFDTSWLKNGDFLNVVKEIWVKPVKSSDPIDVFNIKLKRVKKKTFEGMGG
jgi:hypothetical protein